MFIKDTVFKRLLKRAYTTGFIIGNNDGEVFINAGSWAISVKEKEIPNKIKASIIELTGEIPAAGEVFSAMKGSANQYEISWERIINIAKNFSEATISLEEPPIILCFSEREYRVYQERDTQKCILIKREIDCIRNNLEIENDETLPSVPMMRENEKTVYWKNNVMALAIATAVLGEEKSEILEFLESKKLYKDGEV